MAGEGSNRFSGLKSDDSKKATTAILRPNALLERLKNKEKSSSAGGLSLRFQLGGAVSLRPGGKEGTFKATGGVLAAGCRRIKKRRGDPNKVYTPSQLKTVMRQFQDFPFKGIDGVFGGSYGKDHWFNFNTQRKAERQPIYNSRKEGKVDKPSGTGEGEEKESKDGGEAEGSGNQKQEFENRAKVRWVPPTIRRQQQAEEAKDNPELQKKLKEEEITGTVRGYLNKMTPEKFDTLSEQLIQWLEENIATSGQLMNVVSHIFDKSIQEPKYGGMYARLCDAFHKREKQGNQALVFSEGGRKIAFRRNLLNQCQREFEKGNSIPEFSGSHEERERAIMKQGKIMMGTIKFIGQLYNQDLLPDRIMHECIKHLLSNNDSNPSDEDLEALCNLIMAASKKLDTNVPKNRNLMNQYFRRLESYVKHSGYQLRTQILIRNLVDLRNNNWSKSKWQKDDVARKISEVRSEFAKEKGITNMPNVNLGKADDSNESQNKLNIDGGYGAAAPMMPTLLSRKVKKEGQNIRGRSGGDRYAHQQAARDAAAEARAEAAANPTNPSIRPTGEASTKTTQSAGGAQRKKRFKLLSSSKDVVDIDRVAELAPKEPTPRPVTQKHSPRLEAVQEVKSTEGSPPTKAPAPVEDHGPALAIRRGGGKSVNKDAAKESLKLILDDYCNTTNIDAATQAIKKLMGSSPDGWRHAEVPMWIVEMGIDNLIPGARPLTGKLLVAFTEKGAFRAPEVQNGFHEILEWFEDMLLDMPKFSPYISEVLAEVVIAKVVKLDFLAASLASTVSNPKKPACGTDPTDDMPYGRRAAFLAHLVTAMMTASEDADIGELLEDVHIATDYLAEKDESKRADREFQWTQHYGFDDIL